MTLRNGCSYPVSLECTCSFRCSLSLLTCAPRRQSRNPPLLPPSITLSHFPSPPVPSTSASQSGKACIPTLSHVLSQLLPLTRTLPLSLDMLNKVSFAPESKEEDLHSGALQLPQGSVLVITEGGVQEGKLVERGTKSLHAPPSVSSKIECIRLDEHQCDARSHIITNSWLRFPVQPILIPNRY